MKKKILTLIFIAIILPVFGQQITFTTTSTKSDWTPVLSNNRESGTMKWKASGGGILDQEVVSDKPVFNLSDNTGVVQITIESTDGFAGFWRLWLNYLEVSNLDLSAATNMERLNLKANRNLRIFDLSPFPKLDRFTAEENDLVEIDVSNKPLLNHLNINDNDFPSVQLDKIIMDLDNNGTENGFLNIRNQSTGALLTSAALAAFNNLKAKGWKFDLPEINVTGNGITISGSGTNVPQVSDNTDFGKSEPGVRLVKQFTIHNNGDTDPLYIGSADLVLTDLSPFIIISGTDAADFSITTIPNSNIASLGETIFEITYLGNSVGVKNAIVSIKNNDFDEVEYTFNIKAEVSLLSFANIAITGNDIGINSSGAANLADGTSFGQTTLGNPLKHTFVIKNMGNANLILGPQFFSTNTNFQISSPVANLVIPPGGGESFDITFNPNILGTFNGSILIQTNDPDFGFFVINLTGVALPFLSNQIMITQYYEGSTNSKWIEVINLSAATIPAGTYFLAMYDQTEIPGIATQAPSRFQEIPELASGQVLLFSNYSGPTFPVPGNIGIPMADVINTIACDFDGNDIILISTEIDTNCYASRVDMIGNLSANQWGVDTSYIRGGFSTELPERDFNINSWTALSIEGEVNTADTGTNIALGTQELGSSKWDGTQWAGLKPDRTRNVEINGPYSANNGNLVACNLTVNELLNFDGGTANYVLVSNDLIINSDFILGDKESLLTLNSGANIVGEIIKNEKSTPLNNSHDVTYWSSPVQNEIVSQAFVGIDPNRIFYLNPAAVNPVYAGTIYGHWFIADGSSIMTAGRGYSAEGITTGVQSASFRGKPNNGDLALTVNYKGTPDDDAENDNFNLVGNPYPSTLAIDPLLSDNQNSNLERTIYLWSHNTPVSGGGDFVSADYAIYNYGTGGIAAGSGGAVPNGYIASGQGFMVRTKSIGNGVINFENDDRVVDSIPVFFKPESKKNVEKEKDRLWISLKTDQGGYNQILVGFIAGATDSKDEFDGSKLKSNNPISLYSMIGHEKFSIQGMGPFGQEKEVVLGFDTDVAPRMLTIGIDKAEGVFNKTEVYLVDNLLGITHNISALPYTFEQAISGEFTNRVTLQFAKNSLNVEEILEGSEFSMTNSGDGFRINASKVVKELKVYDMLGRTIINSKPDQQSFYVEANTLKKGTVLIFKVKLENGIVINKKAIKL